MAHTCPHWLAYTFDNPLRRLIHNPEKMYGPYVRPGMTVFDLGCGLGFSTLALAHLVGEKGKVIAVDIQQKMLDSMIQRAKSKGLESRIRPHLAQPQKINLPAKGGFAVAFWMVHEIDDQNSFMTEVYSALFPGSAFFISEPRFHVTTQEFETSLETARVAGFEIRHQPKVSFSHAALLMTPKY